MKVRIFVSYCHDDVKPDNARLKVFIDALQSAGNGLYEILADYQHRRAAIGASLQAYMREIDSADAAIVLLTPGYKQRVLRKGSTGVYTEFRRIYNRLLATEEDETYGQSFTLLPIVFTNTFEEGCPPEIAHLISKDLVWLHVIPDTLKVRREIRPKLDQLVAELVDRIAAIAATKKKVFRERQQNLFLRFLFGDTKSRYDIPENHCYLDSTFVKTATFLRARNREVSFLIGRKGAGKSTITHVLPLRSIPPPVEVLRIDFEQLPLDMCHNILRSHPPEVVGIDLTQSPFYNSYNTLKSNAAAASDLENAFSPIYSYQLLWDLFLHLYFAWVTSDKLPQRSRPRQLIRRLLDRPLKKPMELPERNAIATNVLFVFAFERLVDYLDLLMRREDEGGIPAAYGEVSPTNFRIHVFGPSGWQALQNYLSTLDHNTERLLITADGFDTMVGYFTTKSVALGDTARFERELLLALFQIVLNKGPGKVGGKFYRYTDFCIAIPFDRFYDVREEDRDRYQYRSFTRIAWSGIELSSLVRKRLALLRGVKDPKGPPLEDRLATVMKNGYPELPDEVSFQFGSATYRLPLFIYVLRHTFWRPRDVLFYYSCLLAAADAFGKKRTAMPSNFVRQVIAGATRTIIQDEFLAEFSSTFRNLPEVVRAFRYAPQVLSWEELKQRLDGIKFDTSLPEDGTSSLAWKVNILYEIGMIGVSLNRRTNDRSPALRHAFSFNEPQVSQEELGREEASQLDYILHPVFCEYLHLDTSGNDLILAMDWEYLHKNEVLRGIVPP